jgi:metaxin
VQYCLVPSSNHASPSGILPFLQPAATSKDQSNAPDAVPSNKLTKWTKAQSSSSIEEPKDLRYEAYASMINNALRKAWVRQTNCGQSDEANQLQLYQLYLHPSNSTLVHKLYIEPCSSSSFVQLAISHQLREAAEKELAKTSYSSTISEEDTMRDAAKAFAAFSELLGEDQWFFGQKQPSMFDASVFAYTHLILDEDLQWGENELGRQLSQHQNLVAHRDRIINQFF